MAIEGTTQLRVKIRSLADEARTIRSEERRAKGKRETSLLNSLSQHRKQVVRPEARSALLAYGFLRRVPYAAIESVTRTIPDWRRVRKMIERFTGATSERELLDIKTRLGMWIDG